MNNAIFAVGILLLGVAAVVIVAFLGVQRWLKPVLEAALERYWSEGQAAMEDRLMALEADVSALPRTWEEFATDARKADQRARWHVKRVRTELEERGLVDDEVDALSRELRLVDGSGGNSSGVQSLQDPVAEIPTPSQDPIQRALRKKFYG